MRVLINSLLFDTGGKPIVPYLPEALAVAIRDTGLQRRSDFTRYMRLVFNDWTKYGIGWSRMRRDRGRGEHGMRDADALTRYEHAIYLPLLDQDATVTAPAIVVSRFAVDRAAAVWLFGETAAAGGYTDICAKPFTGSTATWGAGSIFDVGSFTHVLYDGVVGGTTGDVGVVYSRGVSTVTLCFRRWNGSTWSAEVTIATIGAISGNGVDSNRAKIVAFEDDFYIIAVVSGTLRVFKSTDNGATWAQVGSDFIAAEVMGRTVWMDLNGDPAIVWHTESGVYALDISASAVQLLMTKIGGRSDDYAGEGMAVANGRLYVPSAQGGMWELELLTGGVVAVKHIAAPALPTARQGFIRYMETAEGWIFCAYDNGRLTGTQPSIFAWDTIKRAWHSELLRGTAGKQIQWLHISSADDGTVRLHYAERSGLTADHNSTTDERFLADILTDPASGKTIKYEADGYVEIAEDDLGDPHANGAVYESLVEADDLSAADTGEYIKHLYGADGAAWDAATLGNYLSGTKAQKWGTNSLGLALKTIRHRLELYRDAADNTQTPKLKEFEFRAYKNLAAGLLGWIVPIDLEATARTYGRDTEQVISDLETILGSNTLVLFEFGKSGTKRVKAGPGRLGEQSAEGERLREEARRTGVAVVQLEQVN